MLIEYSFSSFALIIFCNNRDPGYSSIPRKIQMALLSTHKTLPYNQLHTRAYKAYAEIPPRHHTTYPSRYILQNNQPKSSPILPQLRHPRRFRHLCEIFAIPLNRSMKPKVSYCASPQEDATFGAQDEAYRYRWTCSCLAVPEYEPSDIRKAVLHALACYTATETLS